LVDRVYKREIPEFRKALEKLRAEFSESGTKTDWTHLRILPLLKHLDSLEKLPNSEEFSMEFSRLRKGVVMFHSDLVYFRNNVKVLKKILESEKKSRGIRI